MTPNFNLIQGDCIIEIDKLVKSGYKFDLSVFSPPFATLMAYSNDTHDMGNSRDSDDEFCLHYGFFAHQMFRIAAPGSIIAVHLQQIQKPKNNAKQTWGMFDIRGHVNRLMEDAGFALHGEVTIPKNPQAQSIRLKCHQLQFSQWEKDSSVSRPALADYVQLFKMPGKRKAPCLPKKQGLKNDDWILWADAIWQSEMPDICLPASVWFDINETRVLNNRATVNQVIGEGHKVPETKYAKDERHMCPLQLDLIERVIKLYSNEGEEVFTPFAGIGSELVVALGLNRNATGIELNRNYLKENIRNCEGIMRKIEHSKNVLTLF